MTTPSQGLVPVTQADRDAAAKPMRTGWAREEMLRGFRDSDERVQVIATARKEGEAHGMEKAAGIARSFATCGCAGAHGRCNEDDQPLAIEAAIQEASRGV